ncbi:MAG: copper homeostasis protein CutC [Balneolaceae bacterium]|nr:MAG: copper homeostasis protein CutC [Balneolaceae bacterium]
MKREKILLESPVFSVDAALKAEEFGVDRIELCSSFPEGGETPGAGMLRYLKASLSIPIFVMIRPRGGDFFYSVNDLSVMETEIEILESQGADGFVFGVLNRDGSVNKAACEKLVEKAGSKPCTFHRAIDVSSSPIDAMDDIVQCGFKRILTSGGEDSVEEGLPVLLKMLEKAGDDIIILPGGGMEPGLIEPLKKSNRLKEVHASCKVWEEIELIDGNTGEKRKPARRLTISREIVEDFKRCSEI